MNTNETRTAAPIKIVPARDEQEKNYFSGGIYSVHVVCPFCGEVDRFEVDDLAHVVAVPRISGCGGLYSVENPAPRADR